MKTFFLRTTALFVIILATTSGRTIAQGGIPFLDVFSENRGTEGEDPYSVDYTITEVDGETFELAVKITPDRGAYLLSAYADPSYSGKLSFTMDNTTSLHYGEKWVESPQVIPSLLPKSNHAKAKMIMTPTTYTRTFKLLKNTDFDVSGALRFVIEPRCTLEEMSFRLSRKEGKLSVESLPDC